MLSILMPKKLHSVIPVEKPQNHYRKSARFVV